MTLLGALAISVHHELHPFLVLSGVLEATPLVLLAKRHDLLRQLLEGQMTEARHPGVYRWALYPAQALAE